MTKTCTKCQVSKPLSSFSMTVRSRDGFQNWCKDCTSVYAREYHLKRKYGLSALELAELIQQQKGNCALCNEPLGEDVVVDHDHGSGAVRGILHNLCNAGLGQFGDSADRCLQAAAYLQHHKARLDRAA